MKHNIFYVTSGMCHWGQSAHNSTLGNVFWLTQWMCQVWLKFRILRASSALFPRKICSTPTPPQNGAPYLGIPRCEVMAAKIKVKMVVVDSALQHLDGWICPCDRDTWDTRVVAETKNSTTKITLNKMGGILDSEILEVKDTIWWELLF